MPKTNYLALIEEINKIQIDTRISVLEFLETTYHSGNGLYWIWSPNNFSEIVNQLKSDNRIGHKHVPISKLNEQRMNFPFVC